jgi:colanic acid/amylovoran biosynthesis glycosyltransferase
MRIAYVINQYPKVSHTFIRREILALERHGHEIVRIALRGWDGEVVDQEDEAERKRTRYVLQAGAFPLLFAVARMALGHPVRFARALRLAFHMSRKAERPLPIHLIYLAEACRIALWMRAANVAHVHAHFGTNAAEVAMQVHELGGPQWSFTVHGPEEFDRAPLIGLAEKVRRCAFVVAVTSYGRSQLYRLVEQKYWPKIHVVHCGLDAAFFSAEIQPVPAAKRLVCIGRLCEQKGHLLLIEAAQGLAAEGVDFELVLVGDGEMRPEIDALITKYGLQEKVRVTGWLGGAEVKKELLSSRALVLPSFAEGLPIVIMEAMALGRPVISTFVGGIPELVTDSGHGWLVPSGDMKALSSAIQQCLAASSQQLSSMAHAARRQVSSCHNIDVEGHKLTVLILKANERFGDSESNTTHIC